MSCIPVFEDPSLPHQIVITVNGSNNGRLAVSCNCLQKAPHTGRPGGRYEPLAVRARWTTAGALAVWREHVEEAERAA